MKRAGCLYELAAAVCFLVAGVVAGLWWFLLATPDHVLTVPRFFAVGSIVIAGPCLIFGAATVVLAVQQLQRRAPAAPAPSPARAAIAERTASQEPPSAN